MKSAAAVINDIGTIVGVYDRKKLTESVCAGGRAARGRVRLTGVAAEQVNPVPACLNGVAPSRRGLLGILLLEPNSFPLELLLVEAHFTQILEI